MMGVSAISAGYIMENGMLDLREVIAATGLVQIALGIIWTSLYSKEEKALLSGSYTGKPN